MNHRGNSNWIGFQEAQKSINALKQEIEIAEKKLLVAKKSFYKDTNPKAYVQSKKPISRSKHLTIERKVISRFKQEPVPSHPQTANSGKIKLTVPKELQLSNNEEEPNLIPTQLPPNPKHAFTKRSLDDFLLFSSETSSVSGVRHSSSERTSSLIASTFKDTHKFLTCVSKDTETPSETSMPSRISTSNKETQAPLTVNQAFSNSVVSGMEWKAVSPEKRKPFRLLHTHFKPDGIEILRDVIERQKKKQEMQLENQLLSNVDDPDVADAENMADSLPLRKLRHVKSLPAYKGFSVPPSKVPVGTRWRQQKNKFTLANDILPKSSSSAPKRIKKVVRCESDIISAARWKKSEVKPKENSNDPIEEGDDRNSTISSKKSEDVKNTVTEDLKNILDKHGIKSIISKENRLTSGEHSADSDASDEKADSETEMSPKTICGDVNSSKVNTPLLKTKSVKRKANMPLEQKAPSPKIRHYDVDKVRDYIKKKKEERRKRHLDENRRKAHQDQKKKECLENLYKYQKSVAKIKPSSPIKKKDSVNSEYKNRPTEIQELSKESDMHTAEDAKKRAHSTLVSKRKKESFRQRDAVESSTSANRSPEKKQECLHIDISMSKFISEQSNPSSPGPKPFTESISCIPPTSWQDSTEQSNKENKSENVDKSLTKEREKKDPSHEESNFGTGHQDYPDFLRSISSVSTPSELSHIAGFSAELLQKMKSAKVSVPQGKYDKCKVLKDLMKSINVMTEPLLHVRRWVEDIPHIPHNLPKKQAATDLNQVKSTVEEHSLLSSLSGKNSFKERVSGIGDVSHLYEKILGRKANSVLEKQNIIKDPARLGAGDNILSSFQNNESNEDDLIEGSLTTENDCVLNEFKLPIETSPHSGTSNQSSHFSDLQKANAIPDPFNLINTWNRKPLALHEKQGKEDAPSKFPMENTQLQDMYTSLLTSSQPDLEESSIKTYITQESHSLNFTQAGEKPSSLEQSIENLPLKTESIKEAESSQKVTSISHHSLEESESTTSSFRSSHISNRQSHFEPPSHVSTVRSSQMSQEGDSERPSPASSFSSLHALNKETDLKKPHSFHETSTSAIDVGIVEESLKEHESASSVFSQTLVSGNISSLYSLEADPEKPREETVQDRASASGSSVSEVISVVENSKGFKSSAEDLLPDKDVSPLPSIASKHSSASILSIPDEKVASSHLETEEMSNSSSTGHHEKGSNHSSHITEKVSHHSSEMDILQSIPSGSQTSIAVDFRQPLRWTLSSRDAVQSSQGHELHEDPYLHTQVVTRVAAEAAAAAATSAVIAVFETQKALLAENNYLGMLHSRARSSSSKKTQYSSDFESSPHAKSSSSSRSSAIESRKSKLQSEVVSEEVDEPSSNESIGEKIPSGDSKSNEEPSMKTSQSSSIKTVENIVSIHKDENFTKNEKPPQRSKRKISGNASSPSPASLSDNESASSETIMSSHSNFSHLSESAPSDDSFAQLTLDVVRRMTHEEELRARQQLSLLQFQENSLVEKARAEMMWLELLKKKLREKGSERKVSSIKRRQKELIFRLRQERTQLRCMQEAYRSICEKHQSLLEDKRKLLKDPNSLALHLLSKDDKFYSSSYSESRAKEFPKPKSASSSTPTIVSDNDIKTIADEESVSGVPEMLKGLASNSSQESVIETQASEPVKTSISSQNKSLQNSPNASFSHLNTAQSHSSPSLPSNQSLETALQGLKKLEASKRHLTKREQRIVHRRKQVENLLQWQMTLDREEMAVRELEQKALDLVDHSKKRTKYYISSSGSAAHPEGKETDSNQELSAVSSKTPQHLSKISDNLPLTTENQISQSISEGTIATDLDAKSQKENTQTVSSADPSGSSLAEEIKSGSLELSVPTAEISENGSQVDQSISEKMSYVNTSPTREKSSSSNVYSDSFESSTSRRTTFHSHSSIKKGPGIRLPLVPRNLRRHDSSGSDDSYTISQSETASDQSDIEVRIHALAEELRRRKAEAEKLKKEHKKKYREQLKEKELSLQKQLEAYNHYIQQAKLDLEHQIESAVSPPQTSEVIVKPRIKWPRPEQVIDSRRVRKQGVLSPDTLALEKKSEPSSPENARLSSNEKDKPVLKKMVPDPDWKMEDDNAGKELSEKSTLDSREISETLSQNDSTEIPVESEIEPSKSVITELSVDLKESSEVVETLSQSSSSLIKPDESISLYSNEKHTSTASSLDDSKSMVETKSQSDTFVSESGSGKTFVSESDLDKTSPKKTDSGSFSKQTVSSEEDSSIEIAKDDIVEEAENNNKVIFQETLSSGESVSEALSVTHSASTEEFTSEELNKSSKCSGSEGCNATEHKTLDKTLVVDEQSVIHMQFGEKKEDVKQSLNFSVVGDQKKLLASESVVVNIVNFLSTSLLNDTFKLFFNLPRWKLVDENSLRSKIENLVCKPEKSNENLAEAFSQSLLDTYLDDTFRCLFQNLRNTKQDSKISVIYSDSFGKLDSSKNRTSSLMANTFGKQEEKNELYTNNNVLQDINDNQIFTKQAEWNVDSLISPSKDQHLQLLEQQLALQPYSFFYRKIPNKPPPPYTPPSSTATPVNVLDLTFVKEVSVPKTTSVKEITKNIDQVTDHILDTLLDGKKKGLALSEIPPDITAIVEEMDFAAPHQAVFIDLMFDLTKEIVLEKYNETEQDPTPWLRPQKLTPKPLLPSSKEDMKSTVQRELRKVLKLDEFDVKQRKQTLWSTMKLGRKKRDFVDTILIDELKEEEPDWVNYDQDEITVKLQIADSVFNILVDDTVKWVKELQLKISS